MSRIHRSLAVAVALATCSTGLLAACGDDDDATDTTTTTAAAATPTSADAPETTAGNEPEATGVAAFCEPYVDVTIMMNGEPDPAALTANVELLDTNAPDEIAESVTVMTDAVGKVLESGGEDYSAFETPEFMEAQAEVDPFVFENCEFDATAEVSGIDYGFEGIPETMEGGRTAILFTNDGQEAHEIAVMRRNDGVTESFEELLAMPEEEAMSKVTPVGGAFAPTNGSQALLVGDFEPGDYVAICFVPIGTAVIDGEMTEGEGDPHFAHGMTQEFTVS